MAWMRFVEDTQVEGRFFPRGADVEVVAAGAMALVLPNPEAHTTMCAVAMRSLVCLKSFRVLLLNHEVGLSDSQFRLGTDEADVLRGIALRTPDCEVLEITAVDSDHA